MRISDNPYWELVSALPEDRLRQLASAVAARKCRDSVGFSTFDEAAGAYRPEPPCPSCGSHSPAKDGFSAPGRRRWRCKECGFRYNSLTGTIFENSKKDLPTWVDFVRLMCWNVPIDACAELCGITHQTAHEWRHRVFATVDGYQDGIVLRDRVWIDEAYVNDTDLSKGYGEARKRGLSGQKVCISVAIDVHKNPVAVVCGHGKPSSRRIREGLGPHIAEGSVVVHDKEKAHNAMIAERRCVSEAYKADVTDAVYLECMALVNSLCSWIKRYLWRFTGMDPANLQSYLNWYVYLFRVNQARDRWPRTERVVRHLMMFDLGNRMSEDI